ncbi:hypothetical protein [Pseudomonas alkylphenolica]|uniref:hypothetical protein n=1 Tax=Pseudomonas alkylphenolica TaxID=237609 RepID=UPI0018D72C54|nr:hypothetical protein [Pseudomonas alkylphenolica]MBH3426576.1 hypothetical protein [Pseudomonas alkylphenolica]
MNHVPATRMQVSPLLVRQGLFLSLALLLTLIAGHLYCSVQVAGDASDAVGTVQAITVPKPTPMAVMQSRSAVATTAPVESSVVRERWVF